MTHADAIRTLAVERYLLDEMPEIERFAFEDHFFDCVECADDLRAGSTMRKAVKADLLPPQPSRPATISPVIARRRWNSSVVLPWAAAAMLALAVGYQSLAPARNGSLQISVLTPVTVRPDSRGALPTVPIAGGAEAVTLALEVEAPAGSDLTYVLRSSAGARIAEGRITAPPAGTPLLLLVPVWTLTPSTQYSLAVQGAADGQPIGEYRFGVAAR
jgi:hypothetical protein